MKKPSACRPVLFLVFLCLTTTVSVAQSQNPSEPFNVHEQSILVLQQQMADGTLSSVELVDQYLARINAYDQQGPALNTIITLNPDTREQAEQLDRERQSSGPRSLLHGIPIVIKDNYNTTDMPTTGASQSLANFVPNREATQVRMLREAGAVILAKTNLHEFAYGITSISSLGGQTRNPYDPTRVPGGSSGGTAAAIAASFAAIGMGSDTCGSIRIPAAFNNLVGLRPTKGLSSIYGIMPLSATQDVPGPLARSIADLAIVLDLTTGYDPDDPATTIVRDLPVANFQARLGSVPLDGLRIGRLTSYMDSADEEVKELIDAMLGIMQMHGAEIIDVEIPDRAELLSRSGLIGHEFKRDLDNYLRSFGSTEYQSLAGIVDSGLYHDAVAGLLGRSADSEHNPERYQQALVARDALRHTLAETMSSQSLDALAYPPIAALPVETGDPQPGNNCSLSGNSGFPALAVPVGFTSGGLPVGLELLGPELSDTRLVAIGYALEQVAPQRKAPDTTPPL